MRFKNAVVSTDRIDRGKESVTQDFDLRDFQRNPVVLWEHGAFAEQDPMLGVPIGKASNTRIEDGRLVSDIELFESHPFIASVLPILKQDGLKALSAGFDPSKDSHGVLSGNSLVEISLCAIGKNPDALLTQYKSFCAKAKGKTGMEYTAEDFKNFLAALIKVLGLKPEASPEEVQAAVESLAKECAAAGDALEVASGESLAEKAMTLKADAIDNAAKEEKADSTEVVKDTVEKSIHAGKISPAMRAHAVAYGTRMGVVALKSWLEKRSPSHPVEHTKPAETQVKVNPSFTSDELAKAKKSGVDIAKLEAYRAKKGV